MGEVAVDGADAPKVEAMDFARPADAPRPGPLALLEALDRDGQVRQAWRVERWPLTVGRALDNDVVLTDPHVAAHHVSLQADAGSLAVQVGDTRNGLAVGRERITSGQTKTFADGGHDFELHIGRVTLRLRLAGHALAAEEPLSVVVLQEPRWLPTLLLALAVLAIVLGNTWIESDPEGLGRAAGRAVLSALLVGALWCTLWALLSKTFTRQSHLGWHLRVFVLASLATMALAVVPPLLAFSFSWPWVTDFSFVATYATVAAAIYFHLLAVEPARRRLMRAVALSGFAAGVALSLWFNVQRTGRPGEEAYMNHLFPPQLRAARAVSVDRFIAQLAPMQAVLDKKAREQTGTDSDSRPETDDED